MNKKVQSGNIQGISSNFLVKYWKRNRDFFCLYTHYEIEATLISNIFETGQNFRKIKQSTGVFFKKIEKISNNSNTYKQQ